MWSFMQSSLIALCSKQLLQMRPLLRDGSSESSVASSKNAKHPKAWLSVKKPVRRWKCPAHFKTARTRHQLLAHVRIIDLDTASCNPKWICGTPSYMSRESPSSPAGDLFAEPRMQSFEFRLRLFLVQPVGIGHLQSRSCGIETRWIKIAVRFLCDAFCGCWDKQESHKWA